MYALAVAITIAILVTIPMLVYHSLHFCVLSSPLAAILRPMPHLLGLAWLAAVSADWTAGLLCLLHVQMYWYGFAESAEGDLNPIHKVDFRWETHILICINAVSDTSLLMDTIYSVHS